MLTFGAPSWTRQYLHQSQAVHWIYSTVCKNAIKQHHKVQPPHILVSSCNFNYMHVKLLFPCINKPQNTLFYIQNDKIVVH